jgi:excisionase family DNA binding protein
MTGDRQYLRAAEIAALTGMSLRTIRRWIAEEILPSTKLGGARLVAATSLKAALSAPHERLQEAADDGEEYDADSEP